MINGVFEVAMLEIYERCGAYAGNLTCVSSKPKRSPSRTQGLQVSSGRFFLELETPIPFN